ncbi:Exportin-1 [Trifolium repens]|nr:Exportin-1 [Trifolium repens]
MYVPKEVEFDEVFVFWVSGGFNHSSSSSSSSSDIAAENLRDLSQPIDVPLLNATVAAFYCTGSKQERSASILRDLQNNPDMWFQVMHILQNTQK